MRSVLLAAMLIAAMPAAFAEKYDGLTVTFDHPPEAVQKAAIDALTVVGVELKKQEPLFLEGKRRNKMGLMVGSGGEVLSVALTPIDGGKTQAKIRTTKTFVGRAGQKVWDQPIADEMTKSLTGGASAASAPAPAPAPEPAAAPEAVAPEQPATSDSSATAPQT
jgi:hypothetical protein